MLPSSWRFGRNGSRKSIRLGVDLGTRSLKLALAEPRGQTWRVCSVDRIPFPDGDPLESGFLRDTLRQWRSDNLPVGVRNAACILPASFTNFDSREFPTTTAMDPVEFALQSMREAHSRPLDEIACDFWYAPSIRNSQAETLHLASTDEQFLGRLACQFERAGLYCRVVDCQPLVHARMSNWHIQRGQPDSAVLVVDLGNSSGILSWVVEGNTRYTRRIRGLATAPALQAVVQKFNMTNSEAEVLLSEIGIGTGKSPTVAPPGRTALAQQLENCISFWLMRVASEITRTFAYLRQQGEKRITKQILLCGGGSGISELANWITQHVGVRTDVVTVPETWDWQAPIDHSPLFSHAIALATLGVTK